MATRVMPLRAASEAARPTSSRGVMISGSTTRTSLERMRMDGRIITPLAEEGQSRALCRAPCRRPRLRAIMKIMGLYDRLTRPASGRPGRALPSGAVASAGEGSRTGRRFHHRRRAGRDHRRDQRDPAKEPPWPSARKPSTSPRAAGARSCPSSSMPGPWPSPWRPPWASPPCSTRGSATLVSRSAVLVTAEARLIQALKKESEEQLGRKDQEIVRIQGNLQSLARDRDRLKLDSQAQLARREQELKADLARELAAERQKLEREGLKADAVERQLSELEGRLAEANREQLAGFRRQAEAELAAKDATLAAMNRQYTESLASFRQERASLEEQARQKEQELSAQLREKTAAAQSETRPAVRTAAGLDGAARAGTTGLRPAAGRLHQGPRLLEVLPLRRGAEEPGGGAGAALQGGVNQPAGNPQPPAGGAFPGGSAVGPVRGRKSRRGLGPRRRRPPRRRSRRRNRAWLSRAGAWPSPSGTDAGCRRRPTARGRS